MDGFKVIGIKRNSYSKNDKTVNSIEIHLSRSVEDFEGVCTSHIYCNDARSQKVYAKCCLLKLNDVIIPLTNKNGQYETLEDVFILSSKL